MLALFLLMGRSFCRKQRPPLSFRQCGWRNSGPSRLSQPNPRTCCVTSQDKGGLWMCVKTCPWGLTLGYPGGPNLITGPYKGTTSPVWSEGVLPVERCSGQYYNAGCGDAGKRPRARTVGGLQKLQSKETGQEAQGARPGHAQLAGGSQVNT